MTIHPASIGLTRLLRRHLFIVGLLAAVGLAFAFPRLGASDGPLRAGLLSQAGVMVIFFLQGLSLKTRELAHGVSGWRLHTFVQAWIFLLSPLAFGLAALAMRAAGQGELAAGFLYLALIPTTISSAVAFTSAAGGNVAGAIFNTTLSNVFGVFWVPTGCVLLFSLGSGFRADLIGPLLLNLAWLILLPLALGQGLRPVLLGRAWFKRVSPSFKIVNHGIILFIVFTAFAKSVLGDTWQSVGAGALLAVVLLSGLCVGIIHGAVWVSSAWVLPGISDRKAALFCGSQKTLAAGAPMALAIFGEGEALAHLNLSLILLPLLCVHPLQLFLAAFLLPSLERKS